MQIHNVSLKSSVLIVDDSPKNLQVLGSCLKEVGLHVEFAIDGHSALAWLKKARFDLILLDIMMPGIDGFEVCRKIKADTSTYDIPVIFITAVTELDSIVKGFNAGASDYITKPFILDELLVRVKTQLESVRSKQLIIEYLRKIEEKNKDIKSSIDYARYIQYAILNSSENDSKHVPDYFIIDSPKDILSGDFYWTNCVKDQVIFAVMDCTGHGVPGALMSILGVTFLNEIIIHSGIVQPHMILEKLRDKLINALGQSKSVVSVKDGMEGTVIVYHPETSEVQFSGTQNAFIHISESQINIIKADKTPIGFFDCQPTYTLKTIKVKKGDKVYMFTDGYIDQFGGPDSKKIKSRRFFELLYKYHKLPLPQQKRKLEEYLSGWKGELEQTDDILVLGIKF